MKSEKFDEGIRRRFEDMENDIPVSDKDLDALQHYVNTGLKPPIYPPFMKAVVGISFISILLASMFSWSLFMQFRHTEMTATIDSLQYKLKQPQAHTIIYKVDTVYIAGNNKKAFDKNSVPRYSPTETLQKYAAASTVRMKAIHPSGAKEKNAQTQFEKNKYSAEMQPIVQLEQATPKPLGTQNDSIQLEKKALAVVETPPPPPDTSKVFETQAPAPLSTRIKNWISPLKNTRIQAGIGMQKGKRSSGNELVIGFLFNKRWSVSTGIRLLKINHERYDQNEGLQQLDGNHFQNFYPADKMDTSAIHNIGTQSTLIQIPLTLTYALPLKKDYALLFGLGTDIDLASRQHIGYDRQENSMPIERKNFETRNIIMPFNNIVFSAGLQKEYRKFSAQFGAFISPQITPVIYKKDPVYAGLRLRLLYNFGK